MGVWGAKNFDNDTAFCFANDAIVKPMIAQLARLVKNAALADAGNHESFKIVAAAEILALLCEKLPLKVPPTELVEESRDLYLQGWDEGIERLATKGNYKEERRAVIMSTFKRLLKVCRRRNSL